jgi:hypothetical protein
VARPLGDHGEEKKAKLAVVEQPAASAPAVMPVVSAVMTMIRDVVGRGEVPAGAVPVPVFHEVGSAAVCAATPVTFAVVVRMIEAIIGPGELMARAIPVSMFHHDIRHRS